MRSSRQIHDDWSYLWLTLMRAVSLLLLLLATAALSEQPPPRQSLTPADATALAEPIEVGRRVLVALARFTELNPAPSQVRGPQEGLLLTRTPTVDLLYAVRCLSESDLALARRFHAALHPMPYEAPLSYPLLTMRTERGLLVFQVSGEVALEPQG